MDSPYHGGAPVSYESGSRPSLGFPLGTALLLLVIFSLSGIFSCCYHWDKLRRSFSLHQHDLEAADGDHGTSKTKSSHMNLKLPPNESMPVLMPGDSIPKFIALPCPCEPPREGKIIESPPKTPSKPPQIAVPLY